MMPSLPGIGWTVFCLLLLWRTMAGKNIRTQLDLSTLHPFIFKMMIVLLQNQMLYLLCSSTHKSEIFNWTVRMKVKIVSLHSFVGEIGFLLGNFPVASDRDLTTDLFHNSCYLFFDIKEHWLPPCAIILGFIFFSHFIVMHLLFPLSSKWRVAMLRGTSGGATPCSGSAGEVWGWSGLCCQRKWQQGDSCHCSGESNKQPQQQGNISKSFKFQVSKVINIERNITDFWGTEWIVSQSLSHFMII